MPRLIEMGRDEEAEVLFRGYEDDGMTGWVYLRTLLDFRKMRFQISRKSLTVAVRENKHIPAYLLGRKKVPQSFFLKYYRSGDESKAARSKRPERSVLPDPR